MKKTFIIDYGIGNLGSVANMIRRLGGECAISSDPAIIRSADRLILPGVGAFDNGMEALNRLGLSDALREALLVRSVPLLGICLGMQLLMEASEEGLMAGLGFVPGVVRRFDLAAQGLRVPHMGWNTVRVVRSSRLIPSDVGETRFYFVHSYYVDCTEETDVTGLTQYGHDFASVLERSNLMGVQFHPEKSHRFGMVVLENFMRL